MCEKLQKNKDYQKFFFLEDSIIYGDGDDKLPLHIEYLEALIFRNIRSNMKKHKKTVNILPMETKLEDTRLIFNHVSIYRDLPRCDHMILFKNLFQNPKLMTIPKKHFPI